MLKKLFNILILFIVLGLVCFTLLLLNSHNCTLTFSTQPRSVAIGNDTLSQMIKEHVKQLREMEMTETPQKTVAPMNKTLGPCPDMPPKLVGPLHVEFDSTRTIDEVREDLSSRLQEGGRYKPPDCISQHKVGG